MFQERCWGEVGCIGCQKWKIYLLTQIRQIQQLMFYAHLIKQMEYNFVLNVL